MGSDSSLSHTCGLRSFHTLLFQKGIPNMFDPVAALMAVALIFQAPDSQIPDAANTPPVRLWLQTIAVEMEILDSREVRYVGARPEDFSSDVNLLRRRYESLKDAPSSADALRFPERTVVNDFLAFNRSYRQHLDVAQAVRPHKWWEYRQALQETDQLYQIWDLVRDARCEYYYVTVRRQALLNLRQQLGDKHYYEGRLPPYVPLWRFQSID